MKKLLFLFLIFAPCLAHSDGYLTIKQPIHRSALGNSYLYPYQNNYNPDIAIFFSEPISNKWSIMSWNGFVSGNTFIFDENVVFSVNDKLRLGIGANYSDGRIDDGFSSVRYQNLEGKIWGEYKLW